MHVGQTKMLNCKASPTPKMEDRGIKSGNLLPGYRGNRTLSAQQCTREQRTAPICVILRHG
jgi:hypothetical protein